MASSRKQQRPGEPEKVEKVPERAEAEDREVDFTGPEVAPAQAQGLQESVGNAALVNMLNEHGRSMDLEPPLGSDVEVGEGGGFDFDEAFADYLAALSAKERLRGGYDVEDWRKLFGGDPDDDPPPRRPKRKRIRHLRVIASAVVPQEDDDGVPIPESLHAHSIPPLGPASDPRGDERLDALWAWLRDPIAAARANLEPEDLVKTEGPLERVATLRRFLQAEAGDPLARSLARLARPLPGQKSLASQLARAASLVELGCLVEAQALGSLSVVNRAASIALEDDCGLSARRAAAALAPRLSAERICEHALADDRAPELAVTDVIAKRGAALLEAAVTRAVRPQAIPQIDPHEPYADSDDSADASTAEIDALLGHEEPASELRFEQVAVSLEAADTLLLLAGRSQVELAACGVAVRRAGGSRPRGPVLALLRSANRRLRALARKTSEDAARVEELVGQPYDEVLAELGRRELELARDATDLARYRDSALAAIALAASGRPLEPS